MSDKAAIILGLILYGAVFILFILGLCLYVKRAKIEQQYSLNATMGFILGCPMLYSLCGTLFILFFGKYILDSPQKQAICLVFTVIVTLITHFIFFISAKGMHHKLSMFLLTYAFALSMFSYLLCAVIADIAKNASSSSSSNQSELEKEAMAYFKREETKDFYRYMKNRW